MKEYRILSSEDKSIVSRKGLLNIRPFEEKLKIFEHYVNTLAADGWIVKSSSGISGYGVPSIIIVVLERDKPVGDASEPAQE